MQAYLELSLTAQTAYLQLLQSALAVNHARTVADLPGSFAAKTVKGHRYWYYQFTQASGKLRQVYVGPEGEPVRALIESCNHPPAAAVLGPLARSAAALGCAEVLPRHLRVIGRLADYGFFSAGGVLVGTHAFLAFGNSLGVRWGDVSRTQDVDLAHAGRNVALALPSNIHIDTVAAIDSLQMGLLPIQGLDGNSGASWLNPRDPAFRVDFLTTLHRGVDEPYRHPRLQVVLQPLRFMEFLLEDVEQAVLFSGEVAAVVNLPAPGRYALHKLLVAVERRGAFQAKVAKDLAQASILLAWLRENRPLEVRELWRRLLERGPGWRERAEQGLLALKHYYPELGVQGWLDV